MKGTLIHTDKGWFISHQDDETGTYIIDVKPGRIDELNRVGTYLQVNSEVDFVLEETQSFPYRFAIPILNNSTLLTDEPSAKSSMEPRSTMTRKSTSPSGTGISCRVGASKSHHACEVSTKRFLLRTPIST